MEGMKRVKGVVEAYDYQRGRRLRWNIDTSCYCDQTELPWGLYEKESSHRTFYG
jgi:hypothetical protein